MNEEIHGYVRCPRECRSACKTKVNMSSERSVCDNKQDRNAGYEFAVLCIEHRN